MSTSKSKIVEVAATAEHETNKNIDATVSNLKEGVTKAAIGFEVSQAKMKEGVEKGYEDSRGTRRL